MRLRMVHFHNLALCEVTENSKVEPLPFPRRSQAQNPVTTNKSQIRNPTPCPEPGRTSGSRLHILVLFHDLWVLSLALQKTEHDAPTGLLLHFWGEGCLPSSSLHFTRSFQGSVPSTLIRATGVTKDPATRQRQADRRLPIPHSNLPHCRHECSDLAFTECQESPRHILFKQILPSRGLASLGCRWWLPPLLSEIGSTHHRRTSLLRVLVLCQEYQLRVNQKSTCFWKVARGPLFSCGPGALMGADPLISVR